MTEVTSTTHAWILCPHSLFKSFVYDFSDFTPITSLISIKCLVLVIETVCFLWGPKCNLNFRVPRNLFQPNAVTILSLPTLSFSYHSYQKDERATMGKLVRKWSHFSPQSSYIKKWHFRALSKRGDLRRSGVEIRIEMLLVHVPRKSTCGHNPLLL
jgi:hypothetical protein